MNTSRLQKKHLHSPSEVLSHGKVLLIKQGSRSVGWLQIAWTSIVLETAAPIRGAGMAMG